MKLNLTKDLIVFDLESTGLSVVKDRIIQIAILKVYADDKPNELKVKYVNPERPIPQKITDITGITDEMVKNQPTFKQIAKGLNQFIGQGTDLCGFNSGRFDLPMLIEHFNHAGIDFDMSDRRHVDVKRLWHRMALRNLAQASRTFLGHPIENAHDAGADTQATLDVLEAMLDAYNGVDCINTDDSIIISPIINDIEALHEFSKNFGELDFDGWIKQREDGKIVFGKGKYQDQEMAPILSSDKSYYDWMMFKGDFTNDTRKKIECLMLDYRNKLQHAN